MRTIFSKAFWTGAAERMIRAAAASMLGMLVSDKTDTLASVRWQAYLTVAVLAALGSLLMSLVATGTGAGPTGSASAVYDRPRDYGIATPVDANRPVDQR